MPTNTYEHIKNQNRSYYDGIASQYDQILADSMHNEVVRKKVALKFTEILKKGNVLDFGGGTGLDLQWLSKNNYTVFFCEPATAMRRIAMQRRDNQFPNADISFLTEDQTDFSTWNAKLPFEEKMNGVLANFAVLNCIRDTAAFFENLSLVTASEADVFLLVLDYGLKQKLQINWTEALKSVVFGNPMDMITEFNNNRQLIYLHSIKAIKKNAAAYFKWHKEERFDYGFTLIHFKRK